MHYKLLLTEQNVPTRRERNVKQFLQKLKFVDSYSYIRSFNAFLRALA